MNYSANAGEFRNKPFFFLNAIVLSQRGFFHRLVESVPLDEVQPDKQ